MKSNIPKSHWILSILVSFGALFTTATASAAEFCASNASELKSHLEVAASNGEADTIRIAAGHYPVPSNGEFLYDARQEGDDDFDLTISGGWTEGLDNFPCRFLLSQNPFNTILDGGDEKLIMLFHIRENTNLTVRGLTFRNGHTTGWGSGLAIHPVYDAGGGYSGRILIERNAFLNNEAYCASGLDIVFNATGNARVGIVNNTFVGNHAMVCNPAARISVHGGNPGVLGAGIYATNNTVVSNTIENQVAWDSAFSLYGTTPNFYVINNNMWGNDVSDLEVDGGPEPGIFETYRLQNNNIGVYTGTSPTVESGNISVEPEYLPCPGICLPFVLPVPTVNSPLVDAGIHPGNFSPFWIMPALDAAGKPRVAQGTVDIGAYENHDRFFSDRFESYD